MTPCRKDYCVSCRSVVTVCDGVCGRCGALMDLAPAYSCGYCGSSELPETTYIGGWPECPVCKGV